MVHILETAVNAVFPIVLLLLLGLFLQSSGFLTAEFVKIGNKLTFRVLIPCMLFINVYSIESFAAIRWDIVIYSVVMLMVIFALGWVGAILTTKVPERRGVILQCAVRSNTAIIGLSLAAALGGSEAVAIAAVVSAFSLPVLNILAVISLSIFVSGGHKVSIRDILLNIVKNPIILGITAGMIALLIRGFQIEQYGQVVFALNKQLKFLYTALSDLKALASPFALVVLGAQFEFSATKGLLPEIISGTVWRIVLAPLIGIGTALFLSHVGLLSCGVNEYPSLIALFGSPAAVSSAIMAGQMGSDEQLATQLVVWTSIGSIITMFLTVCVLMSMGLLAV